MSVLRLGTRGSLLATTQSGHVADALRALGLTVELVVVRTEGDDLRVPLDAPSRPGAFVAALRDELLAGTVDLVVHSYKDLPSEPLPGLVVAAVPTRQDPRDVLVSRDGADLAGLPAGATVGTSSPRRAAALARHRPDLAVVALRGNVDTRLGAVDSGRVDAAVLAAAGLGRLGRTRGVPLPTTVLLPAPAQGALAVECRSAGDLAAVLAALEDPSARLTVTAERAVLRGIDAACTTAVGALARLDGDTLVLEAELTDHAGVDYARVARTGPADPASADALGLAVAADLLAAAGPGR